MLGCARTHTDTEPVPAFSAPMFSEPPPARGEMSCGSSLFPEGLIFTQAAWLCTPFRSGEHTTSIPLMIARLRRLSVKTVAPCNMSARSASSGYLRMKQTPSSGFLQAAVRASDWFHRQPSGISDRNEPVNKCCHSIQPSFCLLWQTRP